MAAKSPTRMAWTGGKAGCIAVIIFFVAIIFACGFMFDWFTWPVLDKSSSTQVRQVTMPDCGSKRVWTHFDNHGNIIAYTCGK